MKNYIESVTPANFFKTQEEFISALGAAYTQFWRLGYWNGTLALQEVTTDEMVVPTRGQDWDDGGNWRRLHLHSWTKKMTRNEQWMEFWLCRCKYRKPD